MADADVLAQKAAPNTTSTVDPCFGTATTPTSTLDAAFRPTTTRSQTLVAKIRNGSPTADNAPPLKPIAHPAQPTLPPRTRYRTARTVDRRTFPQQRQSFSFHRCSDHGDHHGAKGNCWPPPLAQRPVQQAFTKPPLPCVGARSTVADRRSAAFLVWSVNERSAPVVSPQTKSQLHAHPPVAQIECHGVERLDASLGLLCEGSHLNPAASFQSDLRLAGTQLLLLIVAAWSVGYVYALRRKVAMNQPIGLEQIRIEGLRVFERAQLRPGRLSVVIGANGSGKSTLLDLFVLLSQAMRMGLAKGISSRGGISRILSLGRARELRITLESAPVAWPNGEASTAVVHEFVIEPTGIGYSIGRESLCQDRHDPSGNPFIFIDRRPDGVKIHDPATGQLVDQNWPFRTEELALGQVPGTYAEPADLRGLLGSLLHSAPIVLDERAPMRLPQVLQPPQGPPSPNGDDLVSVLYEMRDSDDDTFEQVTDVLKAAFPRLRKLEFPLVAGGQAALAWHEDGLSSPLYANELSTGTLRFLHLACMLLSPRLPRLVMLDEPELSLHPELLRLLAELFLQASERSQIIVATHSAPLISWLEPRHVVVADLGEEGSTLTRGDQLDLDEWLKSYTMDQLWRMGIVGGRP